jgi:hypothetical protein
VVTITKVCRSCGKELPATSFAHDSRSADGLMEQCRGCIAAYRSNRAAAKPRGTTERQCHDCGATTTDYRCPDCLRKWRRKHGVAEP